MKIIIDIIPHNKQRYNTPGDYWVDENDDIQVRVSKLNNEIYEMAIAIHELYEFSLLRKRGITEPEILAFDELFELKRKRVNTDEPGFAEDSPYRLEHTLATSAEMAFIGTAGESWNKYDKTVIALMKKWKR